MSKTLLLADDSVVIQKLVGLSFASEDVEIVATDNGDDAVTRVRELRPDVVLADVVMPGKSGYEVCEAIKRDPALAHIPVLLLTGTFEAFDEGRASAAGADGHITKPFEAQALVERVKTVIQNAAKPAPAPARTAAAAAAAAQPALDLDDDLFDAGTSRSGGAATRVEFLGLSDSLDVTPSLSEEDLGDALETDFFAAPGDIGDSSLTASRLAAMGDRTPAIAVEDATIAILPEPVAPRVAAPVVEALTDDLGLDDPLEIPEISASAFDLDAAFDPEPPIAVTQVAASVAATVTAAAATAPRAPFGIPDDDAHATTSRGESLVTDLDELLATPLPGAPASVRPAPVMSPAAPKGPVRSAPGFESVDFGRAERSRADFDFGFDVSEQIEVPKADLLEQSFSSLLDVSEPQLLVDPTPPPLPPRAAPRLEPTPLPASPPPPARATAIPLEPVFAVAPDRAIENFLDPGEDGGRAQDLARDLEDAVRSDFDVSSSDLATSTASFADLAAQPPPAASPLDPPTASAARSAEPPFGSMPRDTPSLSPAFTSATSASKDAVAHMSPILQQQVQETLEKVAWEAFSDLSETIVKQVIERIERIAWEVIPQMAETLVREEIRKLKGEED